MQIKLLSLQWKPVVFACLLAAFGYWFFAVRPYFWIADARVETFSLPIQSDLTGRIAQIGPAEGETVRKGQPLFTLDAAEFRSRQKQLQRQMDSLTTQLDRQQQQMDRSMQKYLQDPQEEHFTVFEKAQKQSELVSSELTLLQTEWDGLEGKAQKMVSHAPFDGIVLKRSAEEGAEIAVGDFVFAISDPAQCWVAAQLPESLLSCAALGKIVQVRLTAFPHKKWQGKISWIAPAARECTIPIKISVDDPTFPSMPGLSAKVRIIRLAY